MKKIISALLVIVVLLNITLPVFAVENNDVLRTDELSYSDLVSLIEDEINDEALTLLKIEKAKRDKKSSMTGTLWTSIEWRLKQIRLMNSLKNTRSLSI